MNCPHCGAEVEEGKKFCPDCGFMLRSGTQNSESDASPRRDVQKPGGLSKPTFDAASAAPAPDKPTNVRPVPDRTANAGPATDKPTNVRPIPDRTTNARPASDARPAPSAAKADLPKNTNMGADAAAPVTPSEPEAPARRRAEAPADVYDPEPDVRTDRPGRSSSKTVSDKGKKGGAPAKKKKKKPMSKALKIFVIVFIVAAIAGGGFGANAYVRANFKSWPRMFKVVLGIGSTPVYPATVEEVMGSDGMPAHKFTVKGDNPDVLIVHMLNNQRITFINGIATITIPDSYFIAQNVQSDSETITANVALAIMDNHSKETSVPCDPVMIKVPQTVVQNMTPAESTLETYQTNVTLSMNVLANSTVTINGQDSTSSIANGAFTKSLPVVMGTNTFEILIKTPYYRSYKKTLTINRVLPPVSITVPTQPAKRTESSSITISGTVEKNATLKLEGKGTLTYTKATGAFTVKLSMSTLGLYEGTLTASLTGKNNGVYTYRVERIPNATTYQSQAQTPDLNNLFTKMSTYLNKKLKLAGTISAVNTNTFTLALGNNQSLTFSYYGDTTIAVGDPVTVYGEIQKLTNNVPTCYAWFVVH